MEIKAIKVVETSSRHGSSSDIGGIHLPGGLIAGMETLCGNVDTFNTYEDTNESVNCRACQEIYESIKQSRKKIKFS